VVKAKGLQANGYHDQESIGMCISLTNH